MAFHKLHHFDRQGITLDDLIDFTPALKAEAIQIASRYKPGPLFSPPIVPGTDGGNAPFPLPTHLGGHWSPNGSCVIFFY